MNLSNSLKSIALLVTMISLVSCGSQAPMIDDIKVSTSDAGGDVMVDLSAKLSIGGLQLPNASLPILLPKSGKKIGDLSLATDATGANELKVSINVSETANLDLQQVNLPNGSAIPLIGDRQVIVVPIGKGAEVYISLSADNAAIGLALPIKTFDTIGAKVGQTTLMPLFNKGGIVGSAGVFTSRSAGQNGFALVADVSSVLGSLIKSNQIEDHSTRQAQAEMAEFDFSANQPSKKVSKRIKRELYKMHKRKKQLEL